MPGDARRSTVVLVAERAGVSIASVSRVLNGHQTSPEVRAKVERAAAELDYVPDAFARSLKVGKTEQIAFAVADVGNPVYVTMMHAVNEVVGASGHRLILSSTGNDPAAQVEFVHSINRGFADGLIVVPLRITEELLDALTASRLPTVVVGSLPDEVAIDNVRARSPLGVGLAIDHLVERGRWRIALLNGPLDTVPGAARHGGFLDAIANHELPNDDELRVLATDFTFDAGLPAARRLVDVEPDAVMCANDLLAAAAVRAFVDAGWRIPDDVAIVGMDDTALAEQVTPTLTSVNLAAHRRAEVAAELLLARIDEPDRAHQRVVVDPTLTVRASTGAAVVAGDSR